MAYESIRIRNFKKFRDMELSNFNKINLISGKNNIGKTTLLEALFIHSGGYKPELSIQISNFRGVTIFPSQVQRGKSPWDWLFNRLDVSSPIEFHAELSDKEDSVVRLQLSDRDEYKESIDLDDLQENGVQFKALKLQHERAGAVTEHHLIISGDELNIVPPSPEPDIHTVFSSADAQLGGETTTSRYSELEIEGKEHIVLEILQMIEPKLNDINVVAIEEGPSVLYADVGLTRRIPLAMLGGGLTKVARRVTSIGEASGGAIFIDEFENGIHHSILVDLWSSILKAANKFDTQIFATTHSYECIKAAYEAFDGHDEDVFSFYRLEETSDGIQSKYYDSDALETALKADLEVR